MSIFLCGTGQYSIYVRVFTQVSSERSLRMRVYRDYETDGRNGSSLRNERIDNLRYKRYFFPTTKIVLSKRDPSVKFPVRRGTIIVNICSRSMIRCSMVFVSSGKVGTRLWKIHGDATLTSLDVEN